MKTTPIGPVGLLTTPVRALLWHVSAFRADVTERGRSALVEPPEPRALEIRAKGHPLSRVAQTYLPSA